MTTTSLSSEPTLSEAVYFVMQKGLSNNPKALELEMEMFLDIKGDHGEFTVLLLLILARETTVGGIWLTGHMASLLETHCSFIIGECEINSCPKRAPEGWLQRLRSMLSMSLGGVIRNWTGKTPHSLSTKWKTTRIIPRESLRCDEPYNIRIFGIPLFPWSKILR